MLSRGDIPHRLYDDDVYQKYRLYPVCAHRSWLLDVFISAANRYFLCRYRFRRECLCMMAITASASVHDRESVSAWQFLIFFGIFRDFLISHLLIVRSISPAIVVVAIMSLRTHLGIATTWFFEIIFFSPEKITTIIWKWTLRLTSCIPRAAPHFMGFPEGYLGATRIRPYRFVYVISTS